MTFLCVIWEKVPISSQPRCLIGPHVPQKMGPWSKIPLPWGSSHMMYLMEMELMLWAFVFSIDHVGPHDGGCFFELPTLGTGELNAEDNFHLSCKTQESQLHHGSAGWTWAIFYTISRGLSLFIIFFFFWIFKTILKNWSIVKLQCCVSFRYTAKWFSYTHKYVYSFSDSVPL